MQHSERLHALLAASSASRWLTCTPSAVWEDQFENKSNPAADEGTACHTLVELYLNNMLKRISAINYKSELKKAKSNQYYSKEMDGYAMDCANHVLAKYADVLAVDPQTDILIEQEIDFSQYVPEGFGHNDYAIVGNKTLYIDDLKYGKGVVVDAVNNPQLRLYAIGIYLQLYLVYDIEWVEMQIYQPRVDNYPKERISIEELLFWAEEVVAPLAALAFKGEGKFVAGSHCKFCRARNHCSVLAEENLKILDDHFADANKLPAERVAFVLEKASDILAWIKSIKEYALHESVHNKVKWPGMKLVEGRSDRFYKDQAKIITALKKAKIDPKEFMHPEELVSIGELEKRLGKSVVEKYCGKFIIKPTGKPALVPSWNKKIELGSAEAAAAMFEHVAAKPDENYEE